MLRSIGVTFFACFFIVVLTHCVSLNSVSLTPIPAERKNQVSTSKSKIIILGFNFDNDFVNDAVDDLKRQCPNGKVAGLLTKDENINYFFYFVWKKQITATGFCAPISTASTSKGKTRGTASDGANGVGKVETHVDSELQ